MISTPPRRFLRRITATRLAFFCSLLLCAVQAFAAHFAEFRAADIAALVPPPPAAGSMLETSELEVVLQLQATRTTEQAKRAEEIDREDIFFFAREILGEKFTAQNHPQTAELFALVREDFIALNRTAKAAFSRRRPPFVEARVQPCLRVTDSGSYPSGHGMQSALWSALLSELLPEEKEKFATRGRESRWSRIIAGAHFPSDVEAGRIIGEAFARKILANPDFQKHLATARAELNPKL